MYKTIIEIPSEFIQPLNEMVQLSGAGSVEEWTKNVVRNIIIDYQLKKDLNPEYEKRMNFLVSLWP